MLPNFECYQSDDCCLQIVEHQPLDYRFAQKIASDAMEVRQEGSNEDVEMRKDPVVRKAMKKENKDELVRVDLDALAQFWKVLFRHCFLLSSQSSPSSFSPSDVFALFSATDDGSLKGALHGGESQDVPAH
jgi:hypothetical protein